MKPQKLDVFDDDADAFRNSVHDVAAAIISVRALAEVLAEHVPMLVAVSRSQSAAPSTLIPPKTLDSLPAIPGEIVGLCEVARKALVAMDSRGGATDKVGPPSTYGLPSSLPNSPPDKVIGWGGAKILLVEDEETVRYVLSQTLQVQGYAVAATCDGEEALRLLEEQDFDLVLMDLRMPGMSGWETVERIRQRESAQGWRTRIVGLTASPMLVDQQRAKAAGMDDVLVKPIDETALQSILRELRPR